MKFEELNLKPEIVKALKEMNIVEPTLIQEKSIPIIIEGKDLIGMSKTGSGKTAAFSIPLLEKMIPGKGLQAAIIVPTRELAVQISNELFKFGKYLHFRVATVYGGVSLNPQIEEMARADILVGTPGRIIDHLYRGTLNLSKVNYLVLDEADKMVEMGFIEDVERIVQCTSKQRQILLFGATLSSETDAIKSRYMSYPVEVEAEKQVQEDLLKQYYYDLKPNEKFSLLVHLLNKEKIERTIIFCSARSTVELVAKNLRSNGVKNEMIHGKLSQNKRLQVIEHFNEGKINILVASSVAARGLDIKDISHVFNYDLSRDPQEYVHRIGRTARAGESGKAITLLCPNDHETFRDILKRYRVNVEELPLEEFPKLNFEKGFSSDSYGSRGGYNRGSSRSSYGQGNNRSSNAGGYNRDNNYNRSYSRPRSDRPNSSNSVSRNWSRQ